MPQISLQKLQPSLPQVPRFNAIFSQIGRNFEGRPALQEAAHRMLGSSSAFLSFAEYSLSQPCESNATAPRLVAVSEQFREYYRRLPPYLKGNWFAHVLRQERNTLKDAFEKIPLDHNTRHGWHALLTRPESAGSQKRYALVSTLTSSEGKLFDPAGEYRKLFPQSEGWQNIRHLSSRIERISGQRAGRVHIFQPDSALPNFEGIAIDGSYFFRDWRYAVVYTMHSGFFFVCDSWHLAGWLKSSGAREAFGGKIRLSGTLYDATAAEHTIFKKLVVPSFEKFIAGKSFAPQYARQRYLAEIVDKFARPRLPHLKFNRNLVERILIDRRLLSRVNR